MKKKLGSKAISSIPLTREKWVWIVLILAIVAGFIVFFVQNQYVASRQGFGPVSLGGGSPFNQVRIGLECGSQDGSYPSDLSDIYCKILVKSLGPSIPEMDFSVAIRSADNRTLINCQSTVRDINPWFDSGGYCVDQTGGSYLELPHGDYTILITKFGVPGPEVGFVLTKATPPVFRGELHIMSAFERQTRQTDDGASLATFFAFLFIIPTMIIELRSFLREKPLTLPKLVYFDTSVWLAPYDELTEPRKEQVPAIEQLIDKHKSNEITLRTSRQVMNELRDLLRNSEKAEKASKALERLGTLHLTQLPLAIAVYGRAVYGEARYGQEPKFDEISLKEKDKLIAEFMTANSLDYFVSVDNDFLKRKAEIESLLAREHTSVLEPQELLRELRN